jgi:hypothetical protein
MNPVIGQDLDGDINIELVVVPQPYGGKCPAAQYPLYLVAADVLHDGSAL